MTYSAEAVETLVKTLVESERERCYLIAQLASIGKFDTIMLDQIKSGHVPESMRVMREKARDFLDAHT